MSLIAVLAVAAAVSPPPKIAPPQACRYGVTQAAVLRPQDQHGLRSRRLSDMPVADMHLAVDRRVAGCPVPTVVRYGR